MRNEDNKQIDELKAVYYHLYIEYSIIHTNTNTHDLTVQKIALIESCVGDCYCYYFFDYNRYWLYRL